MKIKMDWMEVTIRDADDLKVDEESHFATWGYSEREILLHSGLSARHRTESLLHEVIHAMSHLRGIGLKERQVRSLASGLSALLLNNSELLEAINPIGKEDVPDKL